MYCDWPCLPVCIVYLAKLLVTRESQTAIYRIADQLLYYKVVKLTTKQIDYTGTKFLTATAPGALASV